MKIANAAAAAPVHAKQDLFERDALMIEFGSRAVREMYPNATDIRVDMKAPTMSLSHAHSHYSAARTTATAKVDGKEVTVNLSYFGFSGGPKGYNQFASVNAQPVDAKPGDPTASVSLKKVSTGKVLSESEKRTRNMKSAVDGFTTAQRYHYWPKEGTYRQEPKNFMSEHEMKSLISFAKDVDGNFTAEGKAALEALRTRADTRQDVNDTFDTRFIAPTTDTQDGGKVTLSHKAWAQLKAALG